MGFFPAGFFPVVVVFQADFSDGFSCRFSGKSLTAILLMD